jgi:MerR family copper efflux transcriptional regulator
MNGQFTIGRLAAAAHVPTRTIRFYESVGLLPPPARSASGYRLYSPAAVRRLQLIKRARLLGLSLPQVKELVDQTFTASCAHLQQTLLARIPVQLTAIDRRMAELALLRQELVALQDHLQRLDGALSDDPVVECEDCPCVGAPEGR